MVEHLAYLLKPLEKPRLMVMIKLKSEQLLAELEGHQLAVVAVGQQLREQLMA